MNFFYSIVITMARAYAYLFFRMKVYRADNEGLKGAIIAPNHTSFLDPPLVSAAWPQEVHFLASDYLFRVPVLGWIIRNLNSHSVARGSADWSAIKTICELLEEGKKVIIFPEGTRSFDGKIAPIKAGIAMIATRSKSSIVPTYVKGAYNAWSRKRKFPKLWGKVAIVFGKPIHFKEFEHLDKKEAQKMILDRLSHSLHALEAWYEKGRKGPIP